MLTERENLVEVMKRGNPERFANEYRAFKLLPHPVLAHRMVLQRGELNKKDTWGVTSSWEASLPGPFPVHKPGLIVMPDVEEWRTTVKAPPTTYPEAEWEPFIAMAEEVDRKSYYVTPMMMPGIFEQAHYLGEITNILAAFYESPEDLKDLLKYITEWELGVAEAICDHLHPDALFHHDDWGTDISTFVAPEMFDEFLLEPYKELYGYYHSRGVEVIVHHSDCYAATLVPEMIDMGINIWQGVTTGNNVPELIEKYGDKITFMGDINSNVVDVPDWTPELIHREVYAACERCGPLSFIPCTTQGGPDATFEGVYEAVGEEIDKYSAEYFANKQ